jgi:GNAT superfamily N-acetyltransferase
MEKRYSFCESEAIMSVLVRRATPADAPIVAEFNRLLAWESEGKVLDPAILSAGVAAVLGDPAKGWYLVAERAGEIVGQLAIMPEWSDWRNAWIWWIESVYVAASSRRTGVFRALFEEVRRLGREAGDVIGLRLYVEENNHRAQQTYHELGMEPMPFLLFHQFPL